MDSFSSSGPEPVTHKATKLWLSRVKMNFEAAPPSSAPPNPQQALHPPLATRVSSEGADAAEERLVTSRENGGAASVSAHA